MTTMKRHPLADPASPAFGIASTAVMGALSLIDPATLDKQQRSVLRVASAVVSGLYAGVTIGGKRLELRILAGVATGAATLRFAAASEAIDVRLENTLRALGVRHPRRWMAAGTAAFIFVGFVADRGTAKRQMHATAPDSEPERD